MSTRQEHRALTPSLTVSNLLVWGTIVLAGIISAPALIIVCASLAFVSVAATGWILGHPESH